MGKRNWKLGTGFLIGVLLFSTVLVFIFLRNVYVYAAPEQTDNKNYLYPTTPTYATTDYTNQTEPTLPVDTQVYINDAIPAANSSSHWFALGKFTHMSKQEILAFFGICVDFDAIVENLSLEELNTSHGFHSKMDGSIIQRDSFAYCSNDQKTSVVFTIRNASVPNYRLFLPINESTQYSKVAGCSVRIYGWQEKDIQAYCCEFEIGNTSYSIETRNLPVDKTLSITNQLLSMLSKP